MVRFIVSILLGAAATFLLFAFMAFLISGGEGRNEPPPPTAAIEIVSQPADEDTDVRRRTPPPPPPPQQPPQTPPNEPDTSDDAGMNLDLGFEVDVGGTDTGFSTDGVATDGEATPIVRINPRYPPAAQRDGINGWVDLRFTIDETGGVTDVEVINSEPRRVFDQEARRALYRWKYKPKIVDGKPVRQPGQTVRLEFNLDEG
ncbi:energy transducer TonB [Pseudidiomarina salinarum]|uniref:Protein TonB n=1 Tax=Pseudidiomarina salinarum TaxID=435908 RepID=A0A094J0J3_9GAMM|nr:energy transducer TonB [Pseudidiomarina salinarum]KFZ31599.1 energy transducer TonB [Pseudidiomarina salinarum]RUO70636.1 energy transducer TonB [Pseudidiomarina salinarum]